MTPNPPLPSQAESPAEALRGLASRAYRVLRLGRSEDRDEVRALLDELHRSRRLLHRVASDDLVQWFDQLEAEITGLIDPIGLDDPLHRSEPSACGCGVA